MTAYEFVTDILLGMMDPEELEQIVQEMVLPCFSSGLFRAMFAMKEIWNGKEVHRRVSA